MELILILKQKNLEKIEEKLGKKNIGTSNPFCLQVVRDKYKQTCIEKYGVENVSQSEEIKKKKTDTCLKHFGVENFLQLEEGREKIKQTCIEKYGVEHPSQNYEIFCKTQKRYEYEGVCFHSSWEVFVYFYLKDNNIEFEYQPKTEFSFEFNRKKS